jgi:hypothetical protein
MWPDVAEDLSQSGPEKGGVMASVLKHTLCTSSGHQHHFTLAVGQLDVTQQYTYRCPETGKTAKLQPEHDGEVVQAPPQGAVLLSPSAD